MSIGPGSGGCCTADGIFVGGNLLSAAHGTDNAEATHAYVQIPSAERNSAENRRSIDDHVGSIGGGRRSRRGGG